MTSNIDDRYVWITLGACLFLAARAARYAITDIVQLTEIDPDQFESERDLARPQQLIACDTLETLTKAPSYSIARSATYLLASCFVSRPNAHRLLSNDSYSSDGVLRSRARRAISFLRECPFLQDIDALPPPVRSSPPRSLWETRAVADEPSSPQLGVSLLDLLFEPAAGLNEATELHEIPSVTNPVAGWTNVPRERPTGDDTREAEVRRRRREAMVFHEGEGDLEDADIFRPRE